MLNLHKWLDEQPSGDAVAMESLRKLADELAPYLEINVRLEDVEPIQRIVKAAIRCWTGSLVTDDGIVVSVEAMNELESALVDAGSV